MWTQTYGLLGLGRNGSALVASLPILVVLVLLGVWRKPAWVAGMCGLAASLVVAVGLCHMPAGTAAAAATYGAAFGIFPILWIVFWAIVLYRITVETGRFDVIRGSIAYVTADPVRQALLIAFGFEAFLEGAAGFGTPVAIAAAMLTGLGFSPLRASMICLLANTAPVAFGSLGIPVITLAATTGLPVHALSVAVAALCAPLAAIMPIYMLAAVGGRRCVRNALVPALLTGLVFAVSQYAIAALVGPQLTDILSALITLAALVLLCRVLPAKPLRPMEEMAFRGYGELEQAPAAATEATGAFDARTVWSAWMPYGLLIACVLLWNAAPIHRLLDAGTRVVRWPYLHDRVLNAFPLVPTPQPYHATFLLNVFSAAGTACMAAALLTAVFCGLSPRSTARLLLAVCRQLALPGLTITLVLSMAFLMNYSGETAILGLAMVHTGAGFPVFSAFLGWLGVFLTGSDTSSNALFGSLQVVTAGRLHLSPVLLAAANSTGGVMGKMISLQTIAVAAAATGLGTGKQSKLFRLTLKHSLVLTALAGCLALLYVHVSRM